MYVHGFAAEIIACGYKSNKGQSGNGSHKKGLWNKSLKEIGLFVYVKGPIFVVKLTYDKNFTQ